MALSFLLVLAATVILIRPETPLTKALHQNSLECCNEKLRGNNSCSNDTHCEPGCFLRVLENSNTVCIICDSTSVDLENITVCSYNYTMERKNHTTVTTVIPKIGGPGVAASLLLGTLLISLFLILSVASFFYLKRSNRLPGIFYRRNKGCHDSVLFSEKTKIRQKGASLWDINIEKYHHTHHVHNSSL
ncbi:uncharacterized protein C1orf159 homolog isoform X2 [Platichthys flesus]|uniref:uncharacterized protein C1orf159 homolog isoform X2 n=1 Tax=Platichthys flesus TaxID=8260 RepID=UPI002DBCD75E|nr:uncharacterized protein C1orf159 homolog isoform X2 [Platichthys flesus]